MKQMQTDNNTAYFTAFSIVRHLVIGRGSSSGPGDSIGLQRGSLENVRSLT